ncbi:hypothetical protein V1508DRAFT_328554, partial [Lipomyces doorenjongii]|uniref:uncharacterized protein n=1 Tax=Lipomyces doorenjongii TaxID=383834 RepID=UPI0034CDB0C9
QRKQFWTEVTRELSQEWPLVSEISDSGASRSVDSDSWFSIQVHPQTSTPTPSSGKSFLPSLNTSEDQQLADGDDDANKMRVRKIRVFPTTAQKETLRQWFGAQRYIYNKCVMQIRGGMKPSQKELRAVLLNSKTNTLNETEKWLDEYAYDLKDEAIRDFM